MTDSHVGSEGEPQLVRARYARRAVRDARYSLTNASALHAMQERQRAMVRLFVDAGWADVSTRELLEVGCGDGGNLLEFLRLGFAPAHLGGIELLDDRYETATERLPAGVRLIHGDAATTPLRPESCDLVFASTLFSSLLDDDFQQILANRMWSWVRPGGAVLWYDFTYDNPANPDVRGVPMSRIRQLFPLGKISARRITLAPPLARRVCALHPSLYSLLNSIPWLRTHVLCWIHKPNE
jgi:SAM-dependent methyltransferase